MQYKASLHALVLSSLLLAGCVQTANVYAVRQWKPDPSDPGYSVDAVPRQPDDKPEIDRNQLEAKYSFVVFVKDECASDKIDGVNAAAREFKGWALEQPKAAVCVQRIAGYAVDQCMAITRHQNAFAAEANLALGAVTLGSGMAAVSYAIKGTSDDRLAAASLAGAAGASNNSRGFLPTNTNVKIADFFSNASMYAEYVGVTDNDVLAARGYEPGDNATRKEAQARRDEDRKRLKAAQAGGGTAATAPAAERPGDAEMIKLARVHDAVFAACSANSYGLGPSHKPYK